MVIDLSFDRFHFVPKLIRTIYIHKLILTETELNNDKEVVIRRIA